VGALKVGTPLYRNEIHLQIFLSSNDEQSNREAYSAFVPTGLTRYYGSQDLHFITCSCYKRRAWLGTPQRRTLFLNILEQTRAAYEFVVAGYVVMPEHFHLLISEPEKGDPSLVMQILKQRFSRQVLTQVRRNSKNSSAQTAEIQHLWEKRFYDFNVWTARKHVEKLHYMHMNPVSRGLVSKPDDWPWSSFRFYAYGEKGLVTVNAPGSARMKVRPPAA
jgi:REP-associated tyrosine transposase